MGQIGTSVNSRKSAGRLHLYMCEHSPLLSAVSDKINTFESLLKIEHAISHVLQSVEVSITTFKMPQRTWVHDKLQSEL
jgi:hypothetical protein